jgi:hypothetical protein
VEQATGFPGAGPVIILGLAAWLLRRGGVASGPAAPAFACALGAMLLFSVIAVGRTALGVEQSEASRYTYIAVALLLPAIGLVLSELAEAIAARRALIGFLLVLVGLHNAGVLRQQSRLQTNSERAFKTTALATAQLATAGAPIINAQPDLLYNPDLTVDDLRRMAVDGKLPSTRGITEADRVAAATVVQYGVGPSGLDVALTAPAVERVAGATQQRTAPGCLHLRPTGGTVEIRLAGGEPMSVTVTSVSGGEMTGFLRTTTPAEYTGPPRTDKLQPGAVVHVNVTARVSEVILRVPAGGATDLCGVA